MPCLQWRTGLLILSLFTAGTPLSAAVQVLLVQGRPVVEGVFVNNHGPYRFLVDTAASMNHIEPALARYIGLSATYRTELTSSAGRILAPGTDQTEVQLGDVRATQQKFLFAGMDVVHQFSSDIQGILGQEFLSRFDYMLDLHARRLTFGRQDVPGQRASFRAVNGRAAIATSLGDLVLDSGTARLILFGINPEGSGGGYMRTLAGSQFVGVVYRHLEVAGRHIWSGDAVAIPASNEPGVAGLLPANLFRTIYMSNSDGYAVLK